MTSLKNKVLLSFIIPIYNPGNNLVRCIKSIQKQKLRSCEIILVDGGSTDNTTEIANNLVDHMLKTKSGRAIQQNIGASIAKGDILLFLHADTYITIKQLLSIKKNKIWGFFKVKFNNNKIKYKILSFFINLRSKLYSYGTGDQVIYVERNIFNKIKGFPNLMIMEDIAICSMLKRISTPIIINSHAITSSRRWDDHGFVRTILKMRVLRFLYHIGVKTHILKRLYK